MMENKGETEIKKTLTKFEGENVKKVLNLIREELQSTIDKLISSEEGIYDKDFPIEFENDMGKWRIESNGNTFVQPKSEIVALNITIKPTGEINYE
jgi:hypothetical protein